MAAKAKKKQRNERMQLKRMTVAEVRRRVRLEGRNEAGEVHVEGKEMEGVETREEKGHWGKGRGGLMLTTLHLDSAGSGY